MYQIKVKVKGLAPVSFNRPSDTLRDELATGMGGGRRTVEEAWTEAEARVYKNDQGLFMPSSWFRKCMLEGASLSKIKYKATSIRQYLEGAVLIVENEIPTGEESYHTMYGRFGKIPPRTGAMAWIQTPTLREGWEVDFTFIVFDSGISPTYVQSSLSTGGAYKGVGNARPQYGRFEVIGWEVLDYVAPEPGEEEENEENEEDEE